MEHHRPPPPLLVVATALVGIATALLVWVWSTASGVSPASLLRALDAARVHPLVLLWVLHHGLLVVTASALVVRDAGRRGLGPASRASWLAAVLVFGVLGVWAYLARRVEPEPARAEP